MQFLRRERAPLCREHVRSQRSSPLKRKPHQPKSSNAAHLLSPRLRRGFPLRSEQRSIKAYAPVP